MDKITDSRDGWVIVNYDHPTGLSPYVVIDTFARTRSKSISNFISGSGESWNYWKNNYNFKCVKAESQIKIK